MPSTETLQTLLHNDQPLDASWLKGFAEVFSIGLSTIVPLLPAALNLEGKPYTLENHFFFEPMFNTVTPFQQVWRTARQVGKSRSAAARIVLMCATQPYFCALCVTPLKEQIHRFSHEYVAPFITDSPLRGLLRPSGRSGSVLRRAFANHSVIYFSYVLDGADRTRGIPAKGLFIDESQNVDYAVIPVLEESLSGKEGAFLVHAGTSKTLDGTLEYLYQQSSQAEWVTRCEACNYHNIAAAEHDLLKMIGPPRDDISMEKPAVICAKCQRPIFPHRPQLGRWEHRIPGKASTFTGYHIPQVIAPAHYASRPMWDRFLGKQRGLGGYTKAKFYNEVLGEPSDEATKLVTITDLKKAAILHRNLEEDALLTARGYSLRLLAVDWGGGGVKGVSLTTPVVLGIRPDGRVDAIFGKKLPAPDDHLGEARECLRLFVKFQCSFFVHDFGGGGKGGSGALRETFIIQAGMPIDKIVPVSYTGGGTRHVMRAVQNEGQRTYWSVDKTRSLQLTCWSIKLGRLALFAYDFVSAEEPGLLHDFLALQENLVPSARGSDIYTIIRSPALPDDFAQAVNIGTVTLWNITGAWPAFASQLGEGGIPIT